MSGVINFRVCQIAAPVLFAATLYAQQQRKDGLWPEDWAYNIAPGVTAKDTVYYSDGIACYAKVFYPKGFLASGKTAGVVLGQGWAGTHFSIEKYAARFAERGLVAMAIDYRGWGRSDGFPSTTANPSARTQGDYHRDDLRRSEVQERVTYTRTRLLPMKQIEDYRNAISYLQGEPGVDPERIGVWGSSYAGGHGITLAATDSRVKAVSIQVPAIAGKDAPAGPVRLQGKLLEDAIQRARTGKGGEFQTGYSFKRMVDIETQQAVAEYKPFQHVANVKVPVQFIVAGSEQLFSNKTNGWAAHEELPPGVAKNYIEVAGIGHFEMYVGEAFEKSSNAAADWFLKHLNPVGMTTGIEMLKPTLDAGIIVTDIEKAKEFYGTILGLKLAGTLPMPGGKTTMYRYLSGTSVLKVRTAEPVPPKHGNGGVREAIGFRLITLYVNDVAGIVQRAAALKPQVYADGKVAFLPDPDGNVIELVAADSASSDQIAIGLTVGDVEASRGFYGKVLGLEERKPETLALLNGDTKYTFMAGKSQIKFWKGAAGFGSALPKNTGSITSAAGLRYFTFIVKDVDAMAAELKRRGAKVVLEPVDFGAVARIMMVEDPDGNWVEFAAPKTRP
jgi:catechol 2,3-dioxygenase-like lactoylglutathione lyase family enzyme/dienelactone hydrolase